MDPVEDALCYYQGSECTQVYICVLGFIPGSADPAKQIFPPSEHFIAATDKLWANKNNNLFF